MSTLEQLQAANDKAHEDLAALQAKKDAAVRKVYDQYHDKLAKAQQKAADAQKAMLDREVAESLLDHPDGRAVATALIAQGGLSQKVVDEVLGAEE